MKFLIRRTGELVLVMIGLSLLIFVISRVLPGDPVRFALGPGATEEQVIQLTAEMGLDKAWYVQYGHLMQGLFRGEFGKSLVTFQEISTDIKIFLPATIELTLLAIFISVLFGVPLGVASALHKDKLPDQLSRGFAFSGVALPAFWLAILAQLLISFKLGWLPAFGRIASDVTPPPDISGSYLLDSLLVFDFKLFGHCLSHILLPAAVLAASPMAMIMRLVRASMLEELGKDYILTARVSGLPQTLITYKYMLRNAFSATLTIIGLLIGFFIGSAFVVETVFAWPGIGRYGVRALQFKDFNAIVAVTLIVGMAYSITNTIVVILYGWLDPRLRFEVKDR